MGLGLCGDLITYTLILTNVGQTIARNVVLTDPLPAGTEFVGAASAPTVTIVNGPPTVWQVEDMNPSAVFKATYVVRVKSTFSGTVIMNQGCCHLAARRPARRV